ncbi:MAG: Asp-tRNA(Asn)/Glu-tRNA(Gln) amidotransferase subunit GatC [Candidatus Babeliales bacterium]|nr:Asp-tRNA(Asn)/Glu-tRNA(Gln) amidotransferase subunit GatC [Candidatus Babeliales bacterium]
MAKITREEVLKLAELSKIDIGPDEIESIIKQLDDVLSYAQRVKEIAGDIEISSNKNVNVFRQDVVKRTDCKEILAQAPESQDNFFVVPKILENK